MHPRINELLCLVKQNGFKVPSISLLMYLASIKATQTEVIVLLHKGFHMNFAESEKFVFDNIELFSQESFDDSVYYTFLYMNYDEKNTDFKYDEDKIFFPMKPRWKSDE